MYGLSNISVTHNGCDYGLIEFCENNAQTALEDANKLLRKFARLKSSVKLRHHIMEYFRKKGQQLCWAFDEELHGCIQRVETAMIGLSVAIHVALLARTDTTCVAQLPTYLTYFSFQANQSGKLTRQTSHNDNKRALDDLTEQLAENFEKLEKYHQGGVGKQESKTIRLIVRPQSRPLARRLSRAISSAQSKLSRQPQTIQTSAGDVSSDPVLAQDQSQAGGLSVLGQDLMAAGAPSEDPSGDQLGHAPEIALDSLSESPSLPDASYEALSLTEQADDDIEITCQDGSIVFIPGGNVHDDGEGGTETRMAFVKGTDELPIARIRQDTKAPLSDAEELVEYLHKDGPTDEGSRPVGAAAKSVNITSHFYLEFTSNDSEDDASSVLSDPSIIQVLCVKRLVLLNGNPVHGGVALRPCHQFPGCDHTKIELLGDGMPESELLRLDTGIFVSVWHGHHHKSRVVRLFKGFETFVYEKCTEPCGHTQLELHETGDPEEDAVMHCMSPFHAFALVGTLPGGSDGGETSSEDDCSRDGDSGHSDDEAGVNEMGPFRSVPCLFCRKTALNPKLMGQKTSESIVRYGTHSYGYRCARCRKISWITGAQPIGVEDAATSDDSESEGEPPGETETRHTGVPLAALARHAILSLAVQRLFGF
jgi:hypothetical protein